MAMIQEILNINKDFKDFNKQNKKIMILSKLELDEWLI